LKPEKKNDETKRNTLFSALEKINHRDNLNEKWGFIIEGLVFFDYDPDVIAQAFRSLSHLAHGGDTNTTEIVNRGGIDLVINLMTTYLNHPGVAEYGCSAIYHISAGGHRLKMLSGGMDLVLQAINKYPEHDKLLKRAFEALGLFFIDDNTKKAAIGRGVIPKIITAFKNELASKKPNSHTVNSLAETLCVIASNNNVENQRKIIEEGGRSLIEEALKQFSNDHRVARNLNAALKNLPK